MRIDGQSVFAASHAELQEMRRKVGYVFQNAALFDSMNVYENVAFGLPEDAEKSLGPREVLRRVVEALEDVNLDAQVVLDKLPAAALGGHAQAGRAGPGHRGQSPDPALRRAGHRASTP